VGESDDRERPRKSWREIDSTRDRSRQAGSDRGDKPKRAQASGRRYRAALDRLFEAGGIGKLLDAAGEAKAPPTPEDETRTQLASKVRDALGPDDVTKAVDAYLAKFELPPEDFDFLGNMLQHRSGLRIADAMKALAALLERGLIAAHLRTIEEVGEDPDLARAAADLRRRLG
jgi:hypothetical protein